MLQTTWIALVLGFWSSLYLLDAFLKTQKWSGRQYIERLDKTGLSVSVCQLRWYTAMFNRTFVKLGQWRPHFLRVWFNCGVVFGLLAMIMSIFLLTLLIFNTFRQQPVDQQVLTPVMPGINLPISQMSYYLLTLLVCGILHEVGHAIAAVREQVRVNGFGLFIFILYPGAYVDLSTEHLQAVSPLRQLRIYCAGVWHNFVIVVLALCVLLILPLLLAPFYGTGESVVITQVTENSAVSGPRGLAVGEAITSLSDCRVTSLDDWSTCISVSMKEPTMGHCMALNLIKDLDASPKNWTRTEKSIDCCNRSSSTHLCFNYHTKTAPHDKYACLPARAITERPMCKLQSDCYIPKGDVCVYPALDNETKLLQVYHGRKPPLLFLGHPLDLHYSVVLSNYVPKSFAIPLNLPYVVETFSKYLISLSEH